MGCSHAEGCPLFPLLNASLSAWRAYYCDTYQGWQDCARYRASRTGQLVPITLLPNGANAQHLRGLSPVDRPANGPRHAAARRPVPPPRERPSGDAWFEPTPPPVPAAFRSPEPPQPGSSHAGWRRPRRRRWWDRFTEWIAGPA